MKGKTLIDAIRNNVESAGTQDPDFNISKALDDHGLATGYKNGKFVYKPKSYRVHVTLAEDGSVSVDDVYMRTAEPAGPGRASWARTDKRQFTRRILNTVEQFKVK